MLKHAKRCTNNAEPHGTDDAAREHHVKGGLVGDYDEKADGPPLSNCVAYFFSFKLFVIRFNAKPKPQSCTYEYFG